MSPSIAMGNQREHHRGTGFELCRKGVDRDLVQAIDNVQSLLQIFSNITYPIDHPLDRLRERGTEGACARGLHWCQRLSLDLRMNHCPPLPRTFIQHVQECFYAPHIFFSSSRICFCARCCDQWRIEPSRAPWPPVCLRGRQVARVMVS